MRGGVQQAQTRVVVRALAGGRRGFLVYRRGKRRNAGAAEGGGVIALCSDCRVQASARWARAAGSAGGGSVTGAALPPGWRVPTCQLFDMLACWLFDLLGSRRVGGQWCAGARSQHTKKRGPGYLNRKGAYQVTCAGYLVRPCTVGTTGPKPKREKEKRGGQLLLLAFP